MSDQIVSAHSLVDLRLSAGWREGEDTHIAVHRFGKFNVWRDLDLLPRELHQEILGRSAGYTGSRWLQGGQLLAPWDARAVHRVRPAQFKRSTPRGVAVEPALGRFYPRGLVEDVPGAFSEDMRPMRLVTMAPDHFTLDFNHPLSRQEVELGVEVLAVGKAPGVGGGRCQECIEDLLSGPGMEMRHEGQATDFFAGNALARLDNRRDDIFYQAPRMVPHLDSSAREQVRLVHGQVLAGRGRILDLMASWDSHLPDSPAFEEVVGLGMNRQELDANPRLAQRIVQDLNLDARLPFPDQHFDAVVCTASVEYLVRPLDVFREVARVLVPGGVFLCSFSNRWFPTKAVALWKDLHEFERIGLVSEYFRQAGNFQRLHTLSRRGLPRPDDDPHAAISVWSDPIYAVWASCVK